MRVGIDRRPGLGEESTPGVSTVVAQDYAKAVGYSRDNIPFSIAETISNAIVGLPLGSTAPDSSKLITQPDIIAVGESEYRPRAVGGLELHEARGRRGTRAPPVVHHRLDYGSGAARVRSGKSFRAAVEAS